MILARKWLLAGEATIEVDQRRLELAYRQLQVVACIGAVWGDSLQPACEKLARTVAKPHVNPCDMMKLAESNGADAQGWADPTISGSYTQSTPGMTLHEWPSLRLN